VLDLSHNRLEEGVGAITSVLLQYDSNQQQQLCLRELRLTKCSIPDQALASLLLAIEAVAKRQGAAVLGGQDFIKEGQSDRGMGRRLQVWLEGNVWGRKSAQVLLGLQEGVLKEVVQDVTAYEVDGLAQVAVQH
jgi:hypothetical protein